MEQWILMLQGIIILLLGFLLRGVFSLKDQIGTMNNEIGNLNTWMKEHEKRDDDWHRNSNVDRRDLWDTVNKMRSSK